MATSLSRPTRQVACRVPPADWRRVQAATPPILLLVLIRSARPVVGGLGATSCRRKAFTSSALASTGVRDRDLRFLAAFRSEGALANLAAMKWTPFAVLF